MRNEQQVLADIEDGKTSVEAARRDYGLESFS